jgi:hypothetical protein
LVLEIAARQLIPVLVTEVSAQAFRHAARTATASAARRAVASVPTRAGTLHALRAATVISEMPGRVRLQIAGLRGNAALAAALDARLRAVPGVSRVEVNPLTGKALVQYDPRRTTLPRILTAAEPPAARPRRRSARGGRALAAIAN